MLNMLFAPHSIQFVGFFQMKSKKLTALPTLQYET